MATPVGSGGFGMVGPDHAPAIWLFAIGGTLGLVAMFLISKVTPVVGDDGLASSG